MSARPAIKPVFRWLPAVTVDVSERVLCDECGDADSLTRCILCDGTGFVDELGQVDAEDVARAA